MSIPNIDDMLFLKERLGKARSDRIRYARKANTKKQPGAVNIYNVVIDQIQDYQPTDYCEVNDVLTGSVRMDGTRDTSLSLGRLYNVYQCIEVINTREVMTMMGIDSRQAQRYVRAVKFSMPLIATILERKKQK